MKVFYNEENICIEIPMDYCQKEAMTNLCKVILSLTEHEAYWIVEGRYLNHALDEIDIALSQKKLEKLFRKKNQNMNVNGVQGIFSKDHILLSKDELLDYYADLSICYMEVVAKPQSFHTGIIALETESDANYIYVRIENNSKTYVKNILQCMGIDCLKYVQIEKSNIDWNHHLFEYLILQYPEIESVIGEISRKMKEEEWMLQKQRIKTNCTNREKTLIYQFVKPMGETLNMPVLKVERKFTNSVLKTYIVRPCITKDVAPQQ